MKNTVKIKDRHGGVYTVPAEVGGARPCSVEITSVGRKVLDAFGQQVMLPPDLTGHRCPMMVTFVDGTDTRVRYTGFDRSNLPDNPSPEMLACLN